MVGSFVFMANAQTYTLIDNSFAQATHLIEIKTESSLNNRARSLRDVQYETSGGQPVDVYSWYSPKVPEIHVSWITQINRNLGIIWGIGTGERADKYTINPSLRIGFIWGYETAKNQFLSIMADTYVGGEMNEHSCLADYGDIGGIRGVNCRLAATHLSPEETLDYLEHGRQVGSIRVNYKIHF